MMLSSNRILKSKTVNVDTVNKVVIDIGPPPVPLEPGDVDPYDPDREEKNAQKKAANIVQQAEIQAEDIVNKAIKVAAEKQAAIQQSAEDEADRLTADARERGYSEGMSNATAEGDRIRAEAQQILDDAVAERKAMQEKLEPEIVDMIISITEKLLGNTTDLNPKVVLNLIKQGFDVATISGTVVVYVSPDDYDIVVANKDELVAMTDGSVKLEITKDLSLSPMDCIIETPIGAIDCSLGQQFESLRANLTYILNNK